MRGSKYLVNSFPEVKYTTEEQIITKTQPLKLKKKKLELKKLI